jgi:hypothetical protein
MIMTGKLCIKNQFRKGGISVKSFSCGITKLEGLAHTCSTNKAAVIVADSVFA